jgi:predicted nuclease of restriction endonuclease-like RecB superfamily
MGRAQTIETREKISKALSKPKSHCRGCGKEMKRRSQMGYCKVCHYSSEEYKNAMSKAVKGKVGGYRKGSGRSKGGYYKEIYFDSPFEIEIAKKLDELKINWKRNTKRFYFTYKGRKTYYIPDFYINEDFYLEAKGYWYKDKEAKTKEAVKQNNMNWKLLFQKDWEKDNSILEKLIDS